MEENVSHRTWFLMVAAWLGGCDGGTMMSGEDSGVAEDAAMATTADVTGTVTYEGSVDGSLLVGLWPWDDANPSEPMGPPTDFAMESMPAFPQSYDLSRVRPGSYFIGAVIDVGRDSPTLPGPEDIRSYGDRLDIAAGDALTIDLSLPNE